MKTIVFLGPTLPADEACQLLPGAIIRPPAQQGDIAAAVERDRPHTIVLIDGLFHHTLSPWHKEILYALSRPIRVIGASSLGALRAAECARYGMEPVGEIARWYVEGRVVDDGEVALAHATSEHEYRQLSIPLVNLRATLDAMISDEALFSADAEKILRECATVFYAARTWRALQNRIGGEIVGELQSSYVDQKAIDARTALAVASQPVQPFAAQPAKHIFNDHFRALIENDLPDSAGIRPWQKVDQEIQNEAIDMVLLCELARALGVSVSETDRDRARHRMWSKIGIQDSAAASKWMNESGLTDETFNGWANADALRQAIRDWFTAACWGFDAVPCAVQFSKIYKGGNRECHTHQQ